MIATRTPFRVTLGGGGTDLPAFYREHGGFVFTMAINKYMYVILNPRPMDRKIRILYTRSETVDHVREVQHELAREGLGIHGIQSAMEVASLADIPAGTGMGSSSSYLVGLLHAARGYRGKPCSPRVLAEEACHIELNVLKKPIGKQDQYIAAYGGMSVLNIDKNGRVKVEKIRLKAKDRQKLLGNMHIYYTGHHRDALDILADQSASLAKKKKAGKTSTTDSLLHIKELGHRSLSLIRNGKFDDYGLLLHEHWMHKKKLSSKISLPWVDAIYETTRKKFGVLGGKLIGAGGGGFLMLYTPHRHARLEEFMRRKGLPRLSYMVDEEGSQVVSRGAGGLQQKVEHHYQKTT